MGFNFYYFFVCLFFCKVNVGTVCPSDFPLLPVGPFHFTDVFMSCVVSADGWDLFEVMCSRLLSFALTVV